MKLAILGASGRTGQHLLQQALEAGHEVTALVRNPSRIITRHDNLRIVQGNAKDAEALARAFKGQDAVVSAVGISVRGRDYDLMQASAKAIIAAAKASGIQRVIMMSSFVGLPDRLDFITRQLTKTAMGKIIADIQAMQEEFARSDLRWTTVYAVRLTDKAKTGKARVVPEDKRVGPSHSITRADVASFILHELENDQHIQKTVLITGK